MDAMDTNVPAGNVSRSRYTYKSNISKTVRVCVFVTCFKLTWHSDDFRQSPSVPFDYYSTVLYQKSLSDIFAIF